MCTARSQPTSSKEFNLLTTSVDTGGVSPLDFDVTPLGKFVLYYNGVVAGYKFLVEGDARKGPFNWEDYKKARDQAA